jgi:mutual gliding-motility protein MglA
MAFIDHAQQCIWMKLVYYGSGQSGKTTNLLSLYDQLPEAHRSALLSIAQPSERALFFEYTTHPYDAVTPYTLGFRLTTIPGASLDKAERVHLLQGVDGVVFVIDSRRIRLEETLADFRELSTFLAQQPLPRSLQTIPCVLQYNKRDCPDTLRIETLEDIFNTELWPAFPAIAQQGVGVMATFQAMRAAMVRSLLDTADIHTTGVPERTKGFT